MVAQQEVIKVQTARKLSGQISVPGDKSVSHRTVLLASLAEGKSTIRHFSAGADCASTIRCMRALGIRISRHKTDKDTIICHGNGMYGLIEPAGVLYAGNSGTTMRLLSGILAAQPFFSVVNGDLSLRNRPISQTSSGQVIPALSSNTRRAWARYRACTRPWAARKRPNRTLVMITDPGWLELHPEAVGAGSTGCTLPGW